MPENDNEQSPTTLSTLFQRMADRFRFESIEQLDVPIDPNETGWDRIRKSWQSFNRGEDNIEFHIISNAMSMGALSGFVFGAFTRNRQVFESFVQKHNANVFRGQHEANRRLTDTIYLELFYRSTKHAIRYGLFAGTFVGSLTLAATYRNDLYYRDCAFAGAVTGVIWKAHLGLRATIVNAILGCFFGLSFTAITRLFMKLSGTSIRQMRYIKQIDDDFYSDY
ncbi:RPII140-upstream gene protein-like protein [Euroglyphus maynei]|uniref:Complex I assembly factor TIMMDC1, mitochondrial n=1 Tax=Euroglyphus maynei TaxID=6958 RepID=A0A1Y3BFI3_EURMA|nr:RPII140-upstream gene protein-like protein [Euroglyphus maynei]